MALCTVTVELKGLCYICCCIVVCTEKKYLSHCCTISPEKYIL